ncbi:MAG: phage major capsid protein, partial [Longimicrobiales bacterium]|nr:phage major capsid protein [Longimicrobiales bacterium]
AIEGSPDMLLGAPVFYSERCATLGDEGDLILVNWSQYLEGIYQPLMTAESVHVRFEQHERAFKFWTRNAGACWWRSELTPDNSTTTLSPIVSLAARG